MATRNSFARSSSEMGRADRRLKLFTQSAAVAVMTVGALVLADWALDAGGLKSILPGLASMKANTALGLVLAGAALLLARDEDAARWRRRAARSCAVVILLLALLTLGEYSLGADFGIDQLLFREAPGAVMTSESGRMGINTAFVFVLLGAALLLLDARTRSGAWLGQGATLASLLIALAALIGYGYGVAFLSRFASSTNMALHTALAFVVLSAGLLAARPRRPLTAILTGSGAGSVLARRMWPQAILLLIALGWLRLVGERAGLYETHFGTGLHVVAGIVLFSLLIWRAARQLEQIDAERRVAEDAERMMDARLSVTLRSIGDAVIATDAAGRISFMNAVAESLTGWMQAEAEGRPLTDIFRIVNDQTRATVENPVEKVICEGVVVGLANHTILIAKDGRETPIDDSGAPIRDEAGEIAGVVLVFRDITERKQAETTLARLAAIVESSDDAIVSKDLNGIIRSWNKGAENLFGYAAEEVIGESITVLIPPDRADEEVRVLECIRRGEKIDHYETVRRRKDGGRVEISLSVSPLRDNAGEIVGASKIARDITERKWAEERLRESEERFSKAFKASPMALTITSLTTGELVEVNETFVQATGYTREEALGKTTLDLGLWKRPPDREAELEMVRKLGQLSNVEYAFRTKTGEEIIGLLSAERIEIGGKPFALTVIQDITERKTAEAERERLLAREQELRRIAEQASRLKDEFVATVSHELRTPLNHMLGWVVMLRGGRLGADKAAEALETIERNVRAQNRLVEDLLDVSRILTGKMQLHVQPVVPAQVIEAAVASAWPTAEARGVRLHVVLDSRPGSVSGDPDRLQQVIWNLLSNAIKFTPKGGRVEVRLERINSHIEIMVRDTGEGIAPEFLPYVFDRFSQADSSFKRKHGGLGLGLAVVRHLVELHGGEVSVKSAGLGQGATFTVKLPLRATEQEDKEIRGQGDKETEEQEEDLLGSLSPRPLIPPSLSGVRVLVVDDEADARLLLTAILAESGAEVRVSGGMAEALNTLDGWRPDVLISDIGMPDGDGYEVIREVRRRDAALGQWLPAVALTAYARMEDRLRALSAGFQMHVAKPVEPKELLSVVASLVGRIGRDL